LEKGLWAGALDSVGGTTLAWLTRTMLQNGSIASFGNASGIELNATVLPFILRGVRLLGVDSALTAMPLRRQLWQRLASDLRPANLTDVIQTRALAELPEVFPQLLNQTLTGRVVVELR
jgi:NADPH2:quinone reductase